jgi:uncharacterized protein YjiS (DUF1127 family)
MRLTATHAPESTRPLAAPGLVHSLLAVVRSWLTRRAVLAELEGLDDRTLADLRIHPGDFQAIANGTYAREGGAHDVATQCWMETSKRRFQPYF